MCAKCDKLIMNDDDIAKHNRGREETEIGVGGKL